jgi:hypothetical protein
VRKYLEALDEEALAETLPKRLSLTDPQARWTAAPGGPAFYAYSTNYLIDTEHGVIVDVEPTSAHRTAEVESTKIMIDRVEAQFGIKRGTPYGRHRLRNCADASLDGRGKGHRAACAGMGQNRAQERQLFEQRFPLE